MELKRWDTNEVIFKLEGDSWSDLLKKALKAKISFYKADFSSADFSSADFRLVDFRSVNFRKATFRSANFRCADFRFANFHLADFSLVDFSLADFSFVNFRSVNFRSADFSLSDFSLTDFNLADFSLADFRLIIGDMRKLKSMQLDTYQIVFNKKILCIGCEQHTIEEWENFTNPEISKMGKNALAWWEKWKEHIFKTIKLSYEE